MYRDERGEYHYASVYLGIFFLIYSLKIKTQIIDSTGMNTGIQDAHNLAWKIASFVKGISPPSILHTYETERMPVLSFPRVKHILKFEFLWRSV